MNIIGIAGTNGSGKDSLGEILAKYHGYKFISVSEDLLIPELEKDGKPITRVTMSELSAEWRRQFGMGATVDKILEKFGKGSDQKLVIASLRHPGEAERIHELNGRIVWLDADAKVRYERIYKRGQGEKDQKTYEQFLAEEQAEMSRAGDEATLSVAEVKKKADVVIMNDQNDMEIFRQKVEKALGI